MRKIKETERILSVEAPGRIVRGWWCALAAVHAGACVYFFKESPTVGRGTILALTIAANATLGHLVFRQLCDKITVTFHGVKHMVYFRRLYPWGAPETHEFSFEDFEGFEVSNPMDKGFIRLRVKKKKHPFLLLKLRKQDDFRVFNHIDMITRKQVDTIK